MTRASGFTLPGTVPVRLAALSRRRARGVAGMHRRGGWRYGLAQLMAVPAAASSPARASWPGQRGHAGRGGDQDQSAGVAELAPTSAAPGERNGR
jgi:hypothetical protein